jgi:hypothetical protein
MPVMSVVEVDERIVEAFQTLKALPDHARHRAIRSLWPEPMADRQELWANYNRYDVEMPRIVPSSRDISRMEEVLYEWLPGVINTFRTTAQKRRYHKVVALRAIGKLSWRQIGRRVGLSHTQAKRDYLVVVCNIQAQIK